MCIRDRLQTPDPNSNSKGTVTFTVTVNVHINVTITITIKRTINRTKNKKAFIKQTFAFFLSLILAKSIAQNNSVSSLKSKANFPIGSSIRFVPFMKDNKLRGLQQYHFDSYTAGSDMKMYQIAQKPDVFRWDRVDSIVAYTIKNIQRKRVAEGRNLVKGLRLDRNEKVDLWPKNFIHQVLKGKPSSFFIALFLSGI